MPEHVCNKEEAIDEMKVKLEDIHDAIFVEGDKPSLLSRMRVLEDIALQLRHVVDKFVPIEARVAALEDRVCTHFSWHSKIEERWFKWVFWIVTIILGTCIVGLITWVAKGGLVAP